MYKETTDPLLILQHIEELTKTKKINDSQRMVLLKFKQSIENGENERSWYIGESNEEVTDLTEKDKVGAIFVKTKVITENDWE